MSALVTTPERALARVDNEVAYDLLQDQLEVILELMERPLPEAEVLAKVGSQKILDRLSRYGLVTCGDGHVRAVAKVYDQVRQEGMVAFLERFVLPALTSGAHGRSSCELLHLELSADLRLHWYEARLAPVLQRLAAIVDRPATGPAHRLSLLFVGTSRVETDLLAVASEAAALTVVKQAALQRTSPDERECARLTQADALVDAARYAAVRELLGDFCGSFTQERTSATKRLNYQLAVASHWREPGPAEPEVRVLC